MISVIVPIYNINKYIERCVYSIINQKYTDLEIILVDDGSTDSSGLICDNLSEKDKRIVVIHKENGGLSSARNAGLDIAKGEYIGFVDGDDYISENMYETLLYKMQQNNADLAICSFKEVQEGKLLRSPLKNNEPEKIIMGRSKYQLVTGFETANTIACSKLYKKEIFDGLRFPEGKLHEDQWIIPYVIEKSNKIVKIKDELYFYLTRNNSISKEKIKPNRMWDLMDALKNTCDFFKDKGLYEDQKEEARHLCNYIIKYYSEADVLFESPRNIKAQLISYFRDVMKQCNNVFSFRQVIYQCFRICPPIGIMIKKIREKNV